MAVKITVDEANEELKETKKIYELAVPVILNEYEIIITIVYEETIHPDEPNEPGKNWLKHFEIDADEHPLPYPCSYLDLECRLTRILVELSDAGKIKLDKVQGEVVLAAQKITEEIRKVAKEHEIID